MSKEKNKVRQIGILPSQGADPIPVGKIPDDGTQVVKSVNADNATVTVYVVSSGKTLYLNAVICTAYATGGATVGGGMIVTNASDTEQYYFGRLRGPGNGGAQFSCSFPVPLEIPAGWKVKVVSWIANSLIVGFIHGYEM